MSFEELDLAADQTAASAAPVDIDPNAFGQKPPDLRSIVPPGASDSDLAVALARAGAERKNPFHKIMLPSKGIYYGWSSGWVEGRAWDQQADAILADEQLLRTGQAIDEILRTFVQLPNGTDVLDLIAGDRVYLLYYLRGHTHGNRYEFLQPCSSCNTTNKYVYDMNELQKTVLYADESLGLEPFRVPLPYSSAAVGRPFYVEVRFPRGRDVQQIVAEQRMHKRADGGVVHNAPSRRKGRQQAQVPLKAAADPHEDLTTLVVSANSNMDRDVIRAVVDGLTQADRAVIRDWLKENQPGPDTTVELKCTGCGKEFLVPLPITESFFRPTK